MAIRADEFSADGYKAPATLHLAKKICAGDKLAGPQSCFHLTEEPNIFCYCECVRETRKKGAKPPRGQSQY